MKIVTAEESESQKLDRHCPAMPSAEESPAQSLAIEETDEERKKESADEPDELL